MVAPWKLTFNLDRGGIISMCGRETNDVRFGRAVNADQVIPGRLKSSAIILRLMGENQSCKTHSP